MKINEIFSKNLKRIRKLRGLSQRNLAKKSNLTQKIITGYENNPAYIPLENIEILANALNVSISDFFQDPKNKKKYEINNLDVRWIKKIEEIKKLPKGEQKEISKHINYLIERRKHKKNYGT